MRGRRLKLKTRPDFVKRLTQSPVMIALDELIWNAFDERARTVEISLDVNKLDAVDQIEIRDDGQSLAYDQAAGAFEYLGQSNKTSRTLESGERLHGRRGEGRHKALSLGNKVVWHFTYRKGQKAFAYKVIGTAGREDPFYLTPESLVTGDQTVGCTVTITDIQKSHHKLLYPSTRRELAAQFAPFLLRYTDRQLVYHGKAICPKEVIDHKRTLRAFRVAHEGKRHRVSIQVIHWKAGQARREVFLCSSSGIPLHPISDRALSASTDYTAFVQSDLFERLHEDNLLSNIEMSADDGMKTVVKKVRMAIRKYFRKLQQSEADETLNRLKREGSYPYPRQPTTEIDKVERHAFDLCAISISRHLPNFTEGMDINGRKLLLRMIQEAISQNPTSVGKIIREVCRLPEKDATMFARLLEDVPLSKLVHVASMITERLDFMTFFEAVIYLNPFDRVIKERTELHRILSMNTWLFGEEYAVGTDDENLKAVLLSTTAQGHGHLQ